MELPSEIYLWLSEIIKMPLSSEQSHTSKKFIKLPLNITNELLCGKHMTKILSSLQDGYNSFYKLNLNYTDNLHDLQFNKNDNQMDKNMTYNNWKLIGDSLLNFGIIFDDNQFLSLSQGNIGMIKEVLSKVYSLCNELMKKSILPDLSTFTETPINKNERKNEEMKLVTPTREDKAPIEESNCNEPSSLDIPQPSAFHDISKISTLSRQSNTSNAIDISTLEITKQYSKCESPLEFFIVSLCRNFNIQTRQAVALLSNNRKYLTLLFYKGIKGSFDLNKQWINDITSNIKVLTDLLRIWENNKGIGFATIGVGLYSKSPIISSYTLKALELIRMELGTDHDWIKNEGIDLFIYSINKHETIRDELIKGMYNFTKDIIDDFITQLKSKFLIKEEKNTMINFIMSLMPHFKTIPSELTIKLFDWIINICISSDENCKSFSLSLLTELWFNTECSSTISNDKKMQMIDLFKSAIRDKNNQLSLTGVSLLFYLMDKFAEHKTESGPMIYKTIVFLFLENYDNEIKREHILLNFAQFYFKNINVPLGIFMEPYLNQLNSLQKFYLCDFGFLSKILNHTRLQCSHLKFLIQLSLTVSLNNIYYSKSASLLIVVLFNNKLLFQNQSIFSEGVKLFTTHIKSVLTLYIDNIKNDIYDNGIVEVLYDILIEKIPEINDNVKDSIINAVKFYRKIKGKYTNCLLALLWFYLEHDEVLLQLEEECTVCSNAIIIKNAINTKPSQQIKENAQRDIVIIDTLKKNNQNQMKQSVEDALIKIQKQKEEKTIIKREEMIKKKIKEQKLQRSLEKQLAKKSLVLGVYSVNQSKLSSVNQLIQNEGSIINYSTIKLQQKPINKMKLNTLIDFNFFNFLIKLSEEEPREQKAIDAYFQQFKKRLKNIFKLYIANESFLITKSSIQKMLRDKSFTNIDITLDELSFGIRNCFGKNLNELAFNQFSSLLITLSYLIYSKKNKTYTICECYYNFLNTLLPLSNGNELIHKRDKYKSVINYLKSCINYDFDFIYPPGYKKTDEIKVVYKTKIPKTFNKYLIEPYRISLVIINEIIENAIGYPILEPFLKVKKAADIEIDLGVIHKWSNALTIAYSKLPPIYDKIGIEVADCIEELLNQLCKGRDKMGNVILHSNAVKEEKTRKATEVESKKDEARQKRMKEIKELAEQYKKDKEEQKKQKELKKERVEKEKKKEFHDQLGLTKKKNKQIQEELNKLKKKKEEEEQAKNLLEKQIKHEENLKMQEEKQKFFKNYNRRLKEQFTIIKTQKETITKKKLEKLPINQKLPQIHSNYLNENKSYFEFEKKLTPSIESLRDRSDIKAIFDKYEEHLRTVFDIYVKIGRNKLSLNLPEESIQLNEYKEFLVNFTVFGLIISHEQMNFVFKKLSRKTEDNNQLALSFNDFKTSIMYLIIISRFSDKSIKIMPNDLDNINVAMVNNFFCFIGFILPFDKREIENMINTRRGMSAKAFFEFQQVVKREKVDSIKERKLLTVKSKTRLTSANANRRRVLETGNNSNEEPNANNKLIKSNSDNNMRDNIINGAELGNDNLEININEIKSNPNTIQSIQQNHNKQGKIQTNQPKNQIKSKINVTPTDNQKENEDMQCSRERGSLDY